MARVLRPGYLVGSVIGIAIVLGLGWGLVYALAIEPLKNSWALRTSILSEFDLGSLSWWRNFISFAFDILIIVVAIIGSWWVLATLYREAREAGKWWTYFRSEASRDVMIPRLTLWQRVQHIWLLVTFIICAITGFAAYANVLASRSTLITIHIYSGLAMGVLAVIHFAYYTVQAIVVKVRGESLRKKFPMLEIYTWKFLKNVFRVLVGKKPEPYGKYDPEQLFEYWGVYWGMAVLGVPGLLMLLYGPDMLGGILWTAHFKEAVLAVAFILIVHMGYTHLRPSIFPVDPTFLTGKMPLKRAKEEHPAWVQEELEKLQKKEHVAIEAREQEASAKKT